MIGMEMKEYVQELKELKDRLNSIYCELEKQFDNKVPSVLKNELMDASVSLRVAIDCLEGDE